MKKQYKNGFLLGKFYPFHKGHAYLIEESLKHCEHLTVLVCAMEDDKELFISGPQRYKAMCDYFEGYKNLNLVFHQNNDPQYPEDHPWFWNIWIKIILTNIDPRKTDVVFSSETYGNEIARRLGIHHHCIDLDRSEWPVSGTAVRKDLINKWSLVPQETKRHFIKKVAFIGPESSGKSTISKAIADHLKCSWIEEYGRTFYEKGFPFDDHAFQCIVKRHNRNVVNALKNTEGDLIISDTEVITTKIFYDLYRSDFDCPHLVDLFSIPVEPFDMRILFTPDTSPVQDGTRRF